MDKKKWSVLGFVAAGIGAAISIAAGIIADKKLEIEVDEKVTKAVSDALSKES